MRQRLIGILPYIVVYSLLAGYVLALARGVGSQKSSDYLPVVIGNGEIRPGHGPLAETGQPIDKPTVFDDEDASSN